VDEWQRPCVYLTQEQLLECVRHQGFDIVLVQPSLVPSLYTSAPQRPTSAFPPSLSSTAPTLMPWHIGRTTQSSLSL
jgi:hypothetical protein